jgi:hypothetical protein
MLSQEQIDQKMRNYVIVDSFKEVPLKTHIRYFQQKVDQTTGEVKHRFRTGGELICKKQPDLYVVLQASGKTWSAQVKECVFFRKMTWDECYEQEELINAQHQKELQSLRRKVARLEQKLAKSEQARVDQLRAIKQKYTLTKK